ncbi:MAG TPA: dienelactone hydrolase family protein [Acidimicrobiales bacterium]
MELAAGVTERGVTERPFTLDRPKEPVPGILWTPERAGGPRPLVALGHGGTQHKRAPNLLALARSLVRHHGYAVVAIDLPFHGERAAGEAVTPGADERGSGDQDGDDVGGGPDLAGGRERLRALRRRMFGAEREMVTALALADWTATLDAVQQLDEVGTGPIGYWGLSMGTHFGLPLVAGEPRIVAAVLGLFGWTKDSPLVGYDDQARAVDVPVLFLVQWNDELVPRAAAFELFDLLGTNEKTLHANPGVHVAVPRAERVAAEAFLAQHLGPVEGFTPAT